MGVRVVKHLPLRFAAIAMLLVTVVLGFNGWLTMVSMEKNYIDSVAANYAVAGGETKRNIEYAVRYGKPLENFYGMKELLVKNRSFAKEVDDIRVADAAGKVLYSLQAETVGTMISGKVKAQANFSRDTRDKNYVVVPVDGQYQIVMPLQNREGQLLGYLIMAFDKTVVARGIGQFTHLTFEIMLGFAMGSALVLLLLLWFVPMRDGNGNLRQKRFLAIFITVLALAQIGFAYINNNNFKGIYLDVVKNNIVITADIVSYDINSILQRGVSYSSLWDLSDWLKKVSHSVPEIGGIYITDHQEQVLYQADSSPGNSPELAVNHRYERTLLTDGEGVGGRLTIALSEAYVDQQVQQLLLDIITVAFVSFFFMVEIMVFMLLVLQVKAKTAAGENSDEASRVAVIRPLAFLFFLATDLSISFIPMQMKMLYQPIAGLSQNTVLALPISVEMLGAGLMTIVTGRIIDQRGWRLPFFTGLALVGAGAVLSGLAATGSVFIMARAIVGIGYGFAWMAMRGYVALLPSSAERAKGFSGLSAGIYAGNICACSLGAMLAARLNYSGVFFVAVAVIAVVALFALSFTRGSMALQPKQEAKAVPVSRGKWAGFFGDRAVGALILLVTIPSAMCLTGFLNYFFPLYSSSQGLSMANVGRAFMIYGVSIVYLGPVFSRYIDNQSRFTRIIPLASGIGILAMFVFFIKGGITAALVAIFLFGVADSIGFVAQNTFLLKLPATQRLGPGTALGLFSMTKKLGQMLGPMMIAWGVGFGATQEGIGAIGLLYLGAITVFLVLAVWSRKRGEAFDNI